VIVSRFKLRARADPQTLIRLINYFAQLGFLPTRVRAQEADGLMTVHIEQRGLSDAQERIIAEKMRSSVLVEAVHVRRARVLPASEMDDQ
jgi:hypothetical protein